MILEIINLLLIVLTIFYVVLIFFLLRGWLRLENYRVHESEVYTTTASIVIAARNEQGQIGATIRDILSQNYPRDLYEIIIVDDHSTDCTAEIVRSFTDQGVKLIELKDNEALNSYKKRAITEAINYANGELIVATDADCRMGGDWLKTLISFYQQNDLVFISAPVIYQNEKSLFERLQTLEFLYLIGLGAAGIGNKKATTCNGANLAYKRDVFQEVGGFKGIDDLASGDDELLLHKVSERYPSKIGFCKSLDAAVFTSAKEDISSFISQRKRWASKSTRYKNKSVVILGIGIWLFNLLLMISMFESILSLEGMIVYYCLGAKMLAEFVFLVPICRFAKRFPYLIFLPVLTIVHIVYLIFIGIAGNTGRYQWKGRLVR